MLTKPQFNQWRIKNNKPHATWQGYNNWVTKTRVARAAKQNANPLGSLTQRLLASIPTPAQQTTQATTSVDAALKSTLAGYTSASKIDQLATENQSKRAQGFATALANLTSPSPEAVKHDYQEAADRMRLYGTGLTGAVEAAQQGAAGAAAEHLKAQDASAVGVGDYDPASMRNTLQMSGVVIPGTSLEEEAANQEQLARGQRTADVYQVKGIADQYDQKTQDLRDALALKKTELLATRPELLQKALDSLRDSASKTSISLIDQANQKRATDVQVGTLQLQQAKTLEDQAIGRTNITGDLWVVAGKGANRHLVNTHQPAAGSDAVRIATQAATTKYGVDAATQAGEGADRKVHEEIAAAANTAKLAAAQTSATARTDAAKIAAAARKAAAQITSGKKGGATPKQRSDILKGTYSVGNSTVEKNLTNLWNNVPGHAKQGKDEPADVYEKRYQKALRVFRARKQEHRAEILSRVTDLITPQLQLLELRPRPDQRDCERDRHLLHHAGQLGAAVRSRPCPVNARHQGRHSRRLEQDAASSSCRPAAPGQGFPFRCDPASAPVTGAGRSPARRSGCGGSPAQAERRWSSCHGRRHSRSADGCGDQALQQSSRSPERTDQAVERECDQDAVHGAAAGGCRADPAAFGADERGEPTSGAGASCRLEQAVLRAAAGTTRREAGRLGGLRCPPWSRRDRSRAQDAPLLAGDSSEQRPR